MECNKDEAVRARDIAEKKMQLKDFVGAKRITIKAQQLFPELENISQMLTVCEVHCAAEVKVNGSDDWYGILQVEPTADEASIKKQYRKLALLLHPDKNKFAGAEAAFKLIGEAHRTLSDHAKRSLYDLKRTANVKTVKPKPPSQPNHNVFAKGEYGVPKTSHNFSNVQFTASHQQQHQTQTPGSQTFWTACPFCRIRYQYYRTILNRSLRCQNCMKPFVAYDLSAQSIPTAMNSGYPMNQPGVGVPQNKEVSGQNVSKNSQQAGSGNVPSNKVFVGNTGAGPAVVEPSTYVGSKTEAGGRSRNKEDSHVASQSGKEHKVKVEKVKLEAKVRAKAANSSGTARRKRTRTVVESSDSECVYTEEEVIEGVNPPSKNANSSTNHQPRRSNRQKHNVTNDDEHNDKDVSILKRLRKGKSSPVTAHMNEGNIASKTHEGDNRAGSIPNEDGACNRHKKSEDHKSNLTEEPAGERKMPGASPSSKADSDACHADLDTYSYPDTEFYDFEKEKSLVSFSVGQIWALYDDSDGMPRYYAYIKNVLSPGFKVRFTWLEHDPVSQAEIAWSDKELPVGSGNFKLGITQSSEDLPMFSHLMLWDKGARKNSFVIRPRRGEVWALFKGWDINWGSKSEDHKLYEYEIAEVLSDLTEGTTIGITPLIKVRGFVSVFSQPVDGVAICQISPEEMLRFSHLVPSYKLSGNERNGIPKGSYELDPASLPSNFENAFPSVNFESSDAAEVKTAAQVENSWSSGRKDDLSQAGSRTQENKSHETGQYAADKVEMKASAEKGAQKCQSIEKKTDSSNIREGFSLDGSVPASTKTLVYEYPESEFYDFDAQRSFDKLQHDQIWALYSDIDGFPKYYAIVSDIAPDNSKVLMSWLGGCPMQEEECRWSDKELPFSCGRFKVLRGKRNVETYDSLQTFSHLVPAQPSVKHDQYDIYPCAGEVWALYRSWNINWEEADLSNAEYDVVEILESTLSGIKVLFLARVKGYNAVFEPKRVEGVKVTTEIPRTKLLQFSHAIPAFRLTEEKGGKLRGFWELDAASVPEVLLFS